MKITADQIAYFAFSLLFNRVITQSINPWYAFIRLTWQIEKKGVEMKKVFIAAGIVVIIIAWYLFRPEKLFINKSVNEGLPHVLKEQNNSPKSVTDGKFHGVAHETRGTATIFELPDGKQVLRLTDFETSNGPDVHDLLGEAPDANDSDTVTNAGYLELGSLKGNGGDQNYEIPSGTDLNKYHSVTIWWKRFGVNFGTAPLSASK